MCGPPINKIWSLQPSHGPYDPCTHTHEISCLKIWSLKSRKSWHIETLIHKSLLQENGRQNLLLGYLYLWRWGSHHHIFIRIRFQYGHFQAMLHAEVQTHGFNRLCILKPCRIGCRVGLKNRYEFVWLWFLRTQPHLTASWSRCHCRQWLLSVVNIKSLHMLPKCCRRWCGCS